jgi:hypothetical protein
MASITSIIIKQQFKSKFKFDQIILIEFVADKLNDLLKLSGEGIVNGQYIKRVQPELKLSEHPNEEKLFLSYLGKMDVREFHKTITTIDFKNELINTQLYCLDLDNKKVLKSITNKF